MQRFISLDEQTSTWQKSIRKIMQECQSLKEVKVYYEYYVDCSQTLDVAEEAKLLDILKAQPVSDFTPPQHEQVRWVVPRIGTFSPWGSKTLDILQNSGLTSCKRIEQGVVFYFQMTTHSPESFDKIQVLLFDKMTQSLLNEPDELSHLFNNQDPASFQAIDILQTGKSALESANQTLGLALSESEIEFLYQSFKGMGRNPSDAELMMFAQINSEHCRHKIFNAEWTIDNEKQPKSLFQMIKNTYQKSPKGILSAYKDNSSVIESYSDQNFYRHPNGQYGFAPEKNQIIMKVETHNHPTAIEPYAGSGTGQGGEIRDEGATGRGSQPKVGLVGFTVSNLHIPDYPQSFETPRRSPRRIQTALEIMLKAPIGGAAFNNEFGRPCICGYFRTYEHVQQSAQNEYNAYGYHKPIMIAGGMGKIRDEHIEKKTLSEGDLLIVLGGPAMKIGIGGGSASSLSQGQSEEALDFASVQRQNPEMQRRAQEVINQCCHLKEQNPIVSIHDVGAGGIANALSEIVHDSDLGASLVLENIPVADSSMSPLEIWCNESQERYIIAIQEKDLSVFDQIAQLERCPYHVVGHASKSGKITIFDQARQNKPVDMPVNVLFADPPRLAKNVKRERAPLDPILTTSLSLSGTLEQVLQCPTVADKSFLITIGDRTVTGLVARDQMVGPWQVPVADCGVSAACYTTYSGEAMSMGERPTLSLISPRAMARMAVSEAILNIFSADIHNLSDVKLSCNWMANAKSDSESLALFDAVEVIGESFCPALGIAVPVGKDSLSMSTQWTENSLSHTVSSPLSLVVSAFAPVGDIKKTLTPVLNANVDSVLLLVDLANQQQRLGGSIFAQVTQQIGNECPDVAAESLIAFVTALKQLKAQNLVLAYHDRSDGGVWATLSEMAFASNSGLDIQINAYLDPKKKCPLHALLNEESGVVLQVPKAELDSVMGILADVNLETSTFHIATLNQENTIRIFNDKECIYQKDQNALHQLWSATSYHMQTLRDNPECAKEAYTALDTNNNPGLNFCITQDYHLSKPSIEGQLKPKVAILREQGVNGQVEMAAAFTLAGFETHDVSMEALLNGQTLDDYHGLAVCGGFSYGDVLGAGLGWANTILQVPHLNKVFRDFFHRQDTFTFGVCNGCQMLSAIKSLIPGAEHWPQFIRNRSDQFEARMSLVEITDSPSILLKGMSGWKIPVAVAHGEGRTAYLNHLDEKQCEKLSSLRYICNKGHNTEQYPFNPNGSRNGATGFTTTDGRVTIMMPHPERVFKTWQLSWVPDAWHQQAEDFSPWMQLFYNARKWLNCHVKI